MKKNSVGKTVKRFGLVGIAVAAMLAALTACGTQKLSEDFDKETVIDTAESVISYINEDDIEGFCGVPMSDQMKETMTVEAVTEVVSQHLANRGAFVEYKGETVIGGQDSDKNDCAVAVIAAEYEEQTVTYTISFDKEMNMIGFYLK